MNLWIELDDKLPYALTLPPQEDAEGDADLRFYVLDYFNTYCYGFIMGREEEVGGYMFTLIPDPKEVQEAINRGDIEENPGPVNVRVREISSVLTTKR